jgi:hypothetical protein
MRSATSLAVVVTIVLAAASPGSRAGAGTTGNGAIDVEVANRTTVTGTIAPAEELDSIRLRVPGGAAMTVEARGLGRGPTVAVRIFDGAGEEITPLPSAPLPRGARVGPIHVAADDLLRIDVRGDGVAQGGYRVVAKWEVPKSVTLDGTAGPAPLATQFVAEAGTKLRATLDAASSAGGARLERVTGPGGFSFDFPAAVPRRAPRVVLPATGAYSLSVAADAAPVQVAGTASLSAPLAGRRLDVSEKSRVSGNGRVVSRMVDLAGAVVLVPDLSADQVVSVDLSGASVQIPPNALQLPTSVSIGPDFDVVDPTKLNSPAGATVRFEANGAAFPGDGVRTTLPFDVAAFPAGFDGLCVLTRDSAGRVTKVPPPYTIDAAAGTVSFQTPHFSAYAVMRPALELATVAQLGGRTQDFAAAADGTIYVPTFEGIGVLDPAAGTLTPFLARGFPSSSDDGTDRLHFSSIGVGAVAAAPGGSLLFADLAGVYRIGTDGRVFRVAGGGGADTVDGALARETGVGIVTSIAEGPGGDVYALALTGDGNGDSGSWLLRIDGATGRLSVVVRGQGNVFDDHQGMPPRDVELFVPGGIAVDSQGRVIVGNSAEILRFDFALDTTDTLVGGFSGGNTRPPPAGVGAPLAAVGFASVDGIAFAPGSTDVLYVADRNAGLIWRLDLVRDRGFVAAGTSISFRESTRSRGADASAAVRKSTLRGPADVAPVGDSLFILEDFAARIRVLRPKL